MKLLDVPLERTVKIIGVEGRGLQAKLAQYGLFTGDCLRVVRCAPLKGPLLVEVNGRSIALGRGIAAKILVEELP